MSTTLNPDGCYGKTDNGREEIATRRDGLPQHQRAVLILLDGKTPLRDLLNRCKSIPNLSEDIRALLERGYIVDRRNATASVGSARTESAVQNELIEVSRNLLGEHAATVIARLEKAGKSKQELAETVESCCKLVKLTIDENKAEMLRERARPLLDQIS